MRLAASSPQAAGRARQVPSMVEWVAREGAAAAQTSEGTSRLGRAGVPLREIARSSDTHVESIQLPLSVRGQTVGVLRLEGGEVGRLDDSQWRFIEALAYYAALGTERVRLAADAARVEALHEADRLKDALLASVSHDLRTPLTTIKALAHELGALGDERSQVIEEQADRLNRLVADLLDLSRLNAGAMPLHVELNALDDLLSAALQDTETRLAGRTLTTELPADGELLVGRFDLALSIRVLVNLIENAIKYSSPGTAIRLKIGRDDVEDLGERRGHRAGRPRRRGGADLHARSIVRPASEPTREARASAWRSRAGWPSGRAAPSRSRGASTAACSRSRSPPPTSRGYSAARTGSAAAQISTCAPSSTTRFGGKPKYAVAGLAFRVIQAKSRSRQRAIPGFSDEMIVSRPRK